MKRINPNAWFCIDFNLKILSRTKLGDLTTISWNFGKFWIFGEFWIFQIFKASTIIKVSKISLIKIKKYLILVNVAGLLKIHYKISKQRNNYKAMLQRELRLTMKMGSCDSKKKRLWVFIFLNLQDTHFTRRFLPFNTLIKNWKI